MQLKLIFRHRKFSSFFWTQFFGAFNDNFFKNALVVLIAFRGIELMGLDAKGLVAIAGGIFILPFFLFSPLAGQISDKFEKSRIIRMTKVWEILVMLVAAVGLFVESWPLLLLVLFLMGTQSTFFGPAKYSIIPDLVTEENLTGANAAIELGTFVAILLGTICGGLATSIDGAEKFIGAALLVVASIGYITSRGVPATPVSAGDLKIKMNPFPEFIELFKIIKSVRVLFNSVLGISWFWCFGAGILSVLPIYCKEYLGANEQVVTMFLAMFTLGIGVGSIIAEKLSFKRVELGLVPIGSLGMTLFLVDLFFILPTWAVAPDSPIGPSEFLNHIQGWRLLADFFFMSIFGGVFIVPLYTLLQERSSPETRSRVIAANNIANAIFMVGASLFVMKFYSWELNTAQIFLVFAVTNMIVAIYIYSIVPEFTLRLYSWVLSHILYRVEVKGLDNIPQSGPVVLAPNHVTSVDWLLIGGACKRPARFVMYYVYFKMPIARFLFKQAKVIPIAGAREDVGIMNRAFKMVSEELKAQEVVCIFPEGRLTPTGKLMMFRPGILKIVEKDPAPVVPVVLHGLWGSIWCKTRSSWWPKQFRRKVTIEFLKPIPPTELSTNLLEDVVAERLGEVPPHQRDQEQD